ncbi:MAG: LysM peptidoglycan-binding domain-containing protein, partial [Microbacterium sp.]
HAEVAPGAAPAQAPRPLPAAAPAATAMPAAVHTARASARTHTVKRGDTVSGIAARHGLRTADVLAWNGLGWKSIIHPGDVLRLSAAKASTSSHAPKASAASKASAARSATTHTVSRGDTLWGIAREHGVSLTKLLRANDLNSSAIIYPGEKLRIPGIAPRTSSSSAKPAASTRKSTATPSETAAPKVTLDREQIRNVKTIISVGRSRGVPDKGIAIALATAMVESWLRNLDYGTHDSLGLFQQRPSTGWGSASQVRDPRRSAAAFFGGRKDPNGTDTRGLLDIPGWRDMDFGGAAQAVQISAYPHRYGLWEKQAYAWLKKHG